MEAADQIFERMRTGGDPLPFKALGACIFAGGFSLGMEKAGFDVIGHLELPDLTLGASVSSQRWPVQVTSVDGWIAIADLLKREERVPDVVYANPPCVAYAGTGKHLGVLDGRMCYVQYCAYELAMRLQPTIWAWELVTPIWEHERGFLNAMAFRASRLGYKTYAFLTSSAVHGGFQDRRRFHFVASRVELDFDGTLEREPPERRGVRSLGDALKIVEEAGPLENHENLYKGAFQTILPYCPPGSHLRDVPRELMERVYKPRGSAWDGSGVPGFAHTRGRLDRPSPNILGGHTVFHPVEDRYLTPRECATIMGFPLRWKLSNSTKAYAEIGKGLCTHNAEFLGRVMHAGLTAGRSATPSIDIEVVDYRDKAPKLSLKMSQNERNAWWAQRHPTEPVPTGKWG